jgi:hypothetical protein
MVIILYFEHFYCCFMSFHNIAVWLNLTYCQFRVFHVLLVVFSLLLFLVLRHFYEDSVNIVLCLLHTLEKSKWSSKSLISIRFIAFHISMRLLTKMHFLNSGSRETRSLLLCFLILVWSSKFCTQYRYILIGVAQASCPWGFKDTPRLKD